MHLVLRFVLLLRIDPIFFRKSRAVVVLLENITVEGTILRERSVEKLEAFSRMARMSKCAL